MSLKEPIPLTKQELNQFRKLLADGKLAKAYDGLAANGYLYAELANGVVKGDTFSGRIALEYLEKTSETQGSSLTEAAIDAIRMAMADAYLNTLGLQLDSEQGLVTRDVLADEAWNFHATVFQNQGLGTEAWTLDLPFKLMEAKARESYWTSVLNSAGDFAKEVMLGLATDFIMKQAALNLFVPITAEEAWKWLHRLHNLETYRAAVEITSAQLDKLASSLPTKVSGKMGNGLDADTVKYILDYIEHAALDGALNKQLSALANLITDPIALRNG